MLSKVRVKYIQSLGQKKGRDDEDVFIAEGPKIIDEFLSESNVSIQSIYALKGWIEKNKHRTGTIPLTEINEADLTRLSQLKTPNEVLALISKFRIADAIDLKNKITLALDTIQDPGNLGSIIRIADWFGIKNIICSKDSAAIYNTKVVQATMGSLSRVTIIYTDLKDWLGKNKEIAIYATVLSGKPVNSIGKIKEGILIIGNESKGIRDEILSLANQKITIPRIGKAESLNAAVAAGIMLSHLTGSQ